MDAVARQTIFLLGFGLRMSCEDVSNFLVNVNKEADFNFYNREEVIYWYCYKKKLRYFKAEELMEKCEKQPRKIGGQRFEAADIREIFTEKDSEQEEHLLLEYLSWLKASGIEDNNKERAYQIFDELLWTAKNEILKIYKEDREAEKEIEGKRRRKEISIDQISPADVEKMICCGIPTTESGNLKKMSLSLLRKPFQRYRLSRQRITGISKRTLYVDRFDLITLNFFLYSQKDYDVPEQRCKEFVDSTNTLLRGCGMGEL